MIRKCLVLFAIPLFAGSIAFAEPLRTFFVKENRMPGPFKAEVGAKGQFLEIPKKNTPDNNGYDVYTAAPYVRFGLAQNFAVFADVPYVSISPDSGESESGLGDVDIGAEFVAYQDIFGYPFIMPHADVSLDTGDEDKGLGAGKTQFTVGASVGTVVMDMFHYVIDARYTFKGKDDDDKNVNDDDNDNYFTFAGAFIWDLNEQFSLLVEGKGTNRKNDKGDYPWYAQGGFSYKATENLMIAILGGGAKNADENTIVSGKIAYSF